jgi:hypothetical protein
VGTTELFSLALISAKKHTSPPAIPTPTHPFGTGESCGYSIHSVGIAASTDAARDSVVLDLLVKLVNGLLLILTGLGCAHMARVAWRGMFTPRDRLLAMSAAVGTKNKTLARVTCWTAFVVGGVLSIGIVAGGVGLISVALWNIREWPDTVSEQVQVERHIRDGIHQRMGRPPDDLTLREYDGGTYIGTATLGGYTWDVTAEVEKGKIRFEAGEREATAVERAVREVLREQTGYEVQKLSLDRRAEDRYTGTAVVNGVKQNLTATISGRKDKLGMGRYFSCEWQPTELGTQEPKSQSRGLREFRQESVHSPGSRLGR